MSGNKDDELIGNVSIGRIQWVETKTKNSLVFVCEISGRQLRP